MGNDITNMEAVRLQLKSQFDRNVVTHYDVQEQIFDYSFSHLSINTEQSVNHPILLTEAFLNPNYCRQCKFFRLLFFLFSHIIMNVQYAILETFEGGYLYKFP